MRIHRRAFLGGVAAAFTPRLCSQDDHLAGEVGITTSSFGGHLSHGPGQGKLNWIDLPRVVRDELGMKVIDLNTSTLAATDPSALGRFRAAAESAGCILTNLKMNQRDLNLGAPDPEERARALSEYKRSINAAALLGCRWARPLPRPEMPQWEPYIEAYRELADYAAQRRIQMLVENFGWMQDDAEALPRVIREVGRNVAASPDIGNWNNDAVRYEGLARAFPLAVTCDFKAGELGPDGEHAAYDLRRCFDIGWKAGFRGPWCLEHAHPNWRKLLEELAHLAASVRSWISAQ